MGIYKLLITSLVSIISIFFTILFVAEIKLEGDLEIRPTTSINTTEIGVEKESVRPELTTQNLEANTNEVITENRRIELKTIGGENATSVFNKAFKISSEEDKIWDRESAFIENAKRHSKNYSKNPRVLGSNNIELESIGLHYQPWFNYDTYFKKKVYTDISGSVEKHIDNYKVFLNSSTLNSSRENILIIGDSFVAGQNVIDDKMIWHNIFAKKINNHSGTDFFNIISVGRNGWNFYDYRDNIFELSKVLPLDYVIIGYLPNDYEPINANITYVNCINGNYKMANIIKSISIFFDEVSSEILKRYCEKVLYTIENEKTKMTSYSSKTREKDALLFFNTITDLYNHGRKNGYEVIIMPLLPYENSGVNLNMKVGGSKIKDSNDILLSIPNYGIDVVEVNKSKALSKRNDKSGWVNHLDWHPSNLLAEAYADDLFEYINKRFDLPLKNTDWKVDEKIFEPIRPFDLNIIEIDKNTFTVNSQAKLYGSTISYTNSFTPDKQKIYPPQSVLCAGIGRPYLEFRVKERENKNPVSLTIYNSSKKRDLVFAKKGFNSQEGDFFREGILVKAGERLNLVYNQDEINLVVASSENGCSPEKEIALNDFEFTVKYQDL
jgi:hypothetical protein